MTFALFLSAIVRRPFSVICSALLVIVTAALVGLPVPFVLLGWAGASLVGLELWHALEPVALRRLKCREPDHNEGERLAAIAVSRYQHVLVQDNPQPVVIRGLRSVVLSTGLLDLFDDRALEGILAQSIVRVHSASLVGGLIVWLANLPLLAAWRVNRVLINLGRLLTIVVGNALILPLVFWPVGYVTWGGRFFGALFIALLGTALISNGAQAAGLLVLIATLVIPGLRSIVDWESRRAERAADEATVADGFGWELLTALETLCWAQSVPRPEGLLGLLVRARNPFTERANRIWRLLSDEH